MPILAGCIIGGGLYLIVGWAHCRNRWLAVGAGVLAAVAGYVGYYECCLLHEVPWELAGRVDLLPRYIAFRMETDVAEDVGRPADLKRQQGPSVYMNWFTFSYELLLVIGFSAAIAWSRAAARRPSRIGAMDVAGEGASAGQRRPAPAGGV